MTPPDDPDDTRDDDVEDPQLRQLRAVWVSMRDEEPSDRGLAALMAAARDKADTLKPRETWWQRAFAMLRRPPVLALATVTVLLGGAIVVARHGDALKSAPAGSESKAAAPADQPADRAQAPAEPSPPAAQPPAAEERGPGAAAPAPDPAATSNAPTTTATVTPAHRKHTTATPRPQRPELAEPAQLNGERPGDGLAIATGGMAPETPPPPPPPRLDDERQVAGQVTEKADAAGVAAPRQAPTIDQLVKQCEAAAARGDCRTVQRLAAEIAKADPGAYRARIAKSSTLARCLE